MPRTESGLSAVRVAAGGGPVKAALIVQLIIRSAGEFPGLKPAEFSVFQPGEVAVMKMGRQIIRQLPLYIAVFSLAGQVVMLP